MDRISSRWLLRRRPCGTISLPATTPWIYAAARGRGDAPGAGAAGTGGSRPSPLW